MAETLDIRSTERPTIHMDQGDFKLRRPGEFHYRDYAKLVVLGERITELADSDKGGGVPENADELDKLTAEAIDQLIVDATPEVLDAITPEIFGQIFDFFNKLAPANEDEAEASETASSSSPGASDSMAASEAA